VFYLSIGSEHLASKLLNQVCWDGNSLRAAGNVIGPIANEFNGIENKTVTAVLVVT